MSDIAFLHHEYDNIGVLVLLRIQILLNGLGPFRSAMLYRSIPIYVHYPSFPGDGPTRSWTAFRIGQKARIILELI
jgi:hypothetical protein